MHLPDINFAADEALPYISTVASGESSFRLYCVLLRKVREGRRATCRLSLLQRQKLPMASAPAGRETLVRRLSSHSTLAAELPATEIPAWATPPMGPLPPSAARPTRRSIATAALISVSAALDLTCNQMLTDGCLRLVNITFNPAARPLSPTRSPPHRSP